MPEDTIFEEDDYKFTFSSTKDPGKIDLYYLKNGDASKPLKVEKDQSLTPDAGRAGLLGSRLAKDRLQSADIHALEQAGERIGVGRREGLGRARSRV